MTASDYSIIVGTLLLMLAPVLQHFSLLLQRGKPGRCVLCGRKAVINKLCEKCIHINPPTGLVVVPYDDELHEVCADGGTGIDMEKGLGGVMMGWYSPFRVSQELGDRLRETSAISGMSGKQVTEEPETGKGEREPWQLRE